MTPSPSRAASPWRACADCGASFLPKTSNQRYCERHGWHSPAYRRRENARRRVRRTDDRQRDPAKLREYRRAYELRKRGEVAQPDVKTCPCGAPFPVEFTRRGQMTSRKWCDDCRARPRHLRADALADLAGVPRCADCGALADLRFSAIARLDADQRCPSCAAAAARSAAHTRRRQNGEYRRGGLWFRWDKTGG